MVTRRRFEQLAAEAAVRSARAKERAVIALEAISALLRDFMAFSGRTDDRLDAIEKVTLTTAVVSCAPETTGVETAASFAARSVSGTAPPPPSTMVVISPS